MESSSFKHNMDGTEVTPSRTGISVELANPKAVGPSDFMLRSVATISCLVAVILLAVSKETETIPVTVIPTLPPIDLELSMRWQYVTAFVYFMVINITAVGYGAISLVISMAAKGSKNIGLVLFILDLIITVLLFSANGAGAGVGLIAVNGNSHAHWEKTCDKFETGCHKISSAIAVSLVASIIFFVLIIVTVGKLRKRSY